MSQAASLQKILYVEDEEDIRTVTQMALEALGGFTLQVCVSGSQALACAAEFLPDLLLIDVMMPEMDGPTTFKALRATPQFSDLPTIFMTAKVQAHEIEGYKNLGAIGVIRKPFDPMTLAQQVRDLWSQHRGRT